MDKQKVDIAGMKVTLETITPTEAHALLGKNTHNRHVKPSLVGRFANAMRANAWRVNGETIKVSITGKLLDGQHRLLAVIESGCTIQSFVVRGLPDKVQQTVDIGVTRTNADVLALEGYAKSSKLLAATLRYLKLIEIGAIRSTGAGQSLVKGGQAQHTADRSVIASFSPQEMMEVLLNYPYIYDSMDATTPLAHAVGGSHSQYAALHAWFATIDPTAANEFFRSLGEGTDLHQGDAIHTLRRYLETRRPVRGGGWSRTNRLLVHALFVKAWNAYRAGKQVRKINWKAGKEELPVPV